MSEIEKIAKAIAKLCEIESRADIPPDRQDISTKRIQDEAAFQRTALEDAMCSLVPETIGDVLSQMKIISYRMESDVEGENETAIKFTLDNILRGSINIAGPDGSPLLAHYGDPPATWLEKTEDFLRQPQPELRERAA